MEKRNIVLNSNITDCQNTDMDAQFIFWFEDDRQYFIDNYLNKIYPKLIYTEKFNNSEMDIDYPDYLIEIGTNDPQNLQKVLDAWEKFCEDNNVAIVRI